MRTIAHAGAAAIGSGFIGTVHVEALRRIGVRVRGILEASPELGVERAGQLGIPTAYATLDELLADEAVEVVHVTSPNAKSPEEYLRVDLKFAPIYDLNQQKKISK